MDVANVQAVPAAVYTGLNSDELERQPEASMVHHATPVVTRGKSSTGWVLLIRGARSLCDQRMTLVMPRSFDLADPHACLRCLEVMANGRGSHGSASSESN